MALCNPYQQWFDNNGKPLAGGLLYSYMAGTTTPASTWQDAGLSILNPNPVILDAAGFSLVWLNSTAVYKFRMTDQFGVQQWTVDNVSGNLLCAPSGPGVLQLSSISVSPASVLGGNSSTGMAMLSMAAPAGGAVVILSSSIAAAAQVPASVTVPEGATSAIFTVTTSQVAANTSVTITGNYVVTVTANLAVTIPMAVAVSSVSVTPQAVQGGAANSTGTVTLNTAAPVGGTVVSLSSSNTSIATVPGSVTVPAGSTTATFTVTTHAVVGDTGVSISATIAGAGPSATLTVTAPGVPVLTTLTLSPTTVQGGSANSTGTIHLTAPALTGGMTVNLSSSNPSASVPSYVTVPAGATQATFTVTTAVVNTQTVVTITANEGGSQATANLTITVPPPVLTIYGGLGAASDATGVTVISGQVFLVPYTGDLLSPLLNRAEVTGDQFGPFTPSDQAIYLLLYGGSHTFWDVGNNAPFSMNPSIQVTVNGQTMYLYASNQVLYFTWTIKVLT